MGEEPALARDPSAVAHERAVLPDHAVTGNQDREVIRAHQLADDARMELRLTGKVVVRARLAEGNAPERAEDGDLRRRELEPAGEVAREGKQGARAVEVAVEPCGRRRTGP